MVYNNATTVEANPTRSFKDRMASAAVSWARARGFDTIAVASTGNAAVSVAAYAAAAELRCVVLGKEGGMVSSDVERSLQAMGAEVRLTTFGVTGGPNSSSECASRIGTRSATTTLRR